MQARLKNPRARCLQKFGFQPVEDHDASPSTRLQAAWFYGYDGERERTCRARAGEHQKKFATNLVDPASGLHQDAMVATSADGSSHPIASLPMETHRARQAASLAARGGSANKLWRHVATTHKVSVSKRPGHGLLISMVEQTKQILQVRVALFGDETQASVVEEAFAFLVSVAKHDIADEVCRAE